MDSTGNRVLRAQMETNGPTMARTIARAMSRRILVRFFMGLVLSCDPNNDGGDEQGEDGYKEDVFNHV
jgi:hypothetical protein